MPSLAALEPYLDFAVDLAREAGEVTLRYFRQGVAVETKADASPVTIADRETEQLLRQRIEAAWPDHGILGEEFGESRPGARFRWILDPIDGTKAFIHGVPLYTVLIALTIDGAPVLGVIHNPGTDETCAAAVGLGCTLNGEPCRVSAEKNLTKSRLNVTCYADFMRRNPKFCAKLLTKVAMARGWSDAYSYLLVASGRAEIALDPEMHLWDLAPLKPIIEEAGGRFTDFEGVAGIDLPHSLATNGLLHDEVLALAALDREA